MNHRLTLSILAVYLACASVWAYRELQDSAFSAREWADAVNKPNWSRYDMLAKFRKKFRLDLEQHRLSRSKIRELLGEPDLSKEETIRNFDFAPVYVYDEYKLSAHEGCYHIKYALDNSEHSEWVDSSTTLDSEVLTLPEIAQQEPVSTISLERARASFHYQNIGSFIRDFGEPISVKTRLFHSLPSSGDDNTADYWWVMSRQPRQFLCLTLTNHVTLEKKFEAVRKVVIFTLKPDAAKPGSEKPAPQ